MKSRHFLTLLDIPKEEIKNLIHRAIELKKMTKENIVYTPLQNKTLALLFDKSSTSLFLNNIPFLLVINSL